MSSLRRFLPGILVAATGVGAGDLITASLAGSSAGLTVLWAVAFGAALKFLLNEGLARWQLATGTTLLEGWVLRLGPWIRWLFGGYLVVWSVVVGAALMNGCGIAGTGLLPIGDPDTSKVVWGIAHGILGLVLVRTGGFALFERLMSVFAGLMFVTVVVTAILLKPDLQQVFSGFRPTFTEQNTPWLLGLIGGVGGTVTLLSYGYWIREHGRSGWDGVRTSRMDLGVAYGITAVFGLAMVVIGSRIEIEGKGAGVALTLAQQLEGPLGAPGRWLFLVGFWGAVFSSLLGVWQGVPYLFADFLSLRRAAARSAEGVRAEQAIQDSDLPQTRAYRLFQLGLVFVPMVLLGLEVKAIQLAYAVFGALFMPLLAGTLLWMNNRSQWVGDRFRSGWLANGGLVVTLLFFLFAGYRALAKLL